MCRKPFASRADRPRQEDLARTADATAISVVCVASRRHAGEGVMSRNATGIGTRPRPPSPGSGSPSSHFSGRGGSSHCQINRDKNRFLSQAAIAPRPAATFRGPVPSPSPEERLLERIALGDVQPEVLGERDGLPSFPGIPLLVVGPGLVQGEVRVPAVRGAGHRAMSASASSSWPAWMRTTARVSISTTGAHPSRRWRGRSVSGPPGLLPGSRRASSQARLLRASGSSGELGERAGASAGASS